MTEVTAVRGIFFDDFELNHLFVIGDCS
uniref:Uncharacterized protein n=1 Tax=Arundo donax TaxID=35708 RepID=A0A0A9DZ21_ARUDO